MITRSQILCLLAIVLTSACGADDNAHDTGLDPHIDSSVMPHVDASIETEGNARDADVTNPCVDGKLNAARAEIDLCRGCHVATTPNDARWSLSDHATDDAARLRDAWLVLGDDLLNVPSQQAGRTHEAATVLSPSSDAYARFSAAIDAIAIPERCDVDSRPDASIPQLPLLGSSHGGHLWNSFCADQPDATALPIDPRTLVQAGINNNGVAIFNAYWVGCEDRASNNDASNDAPTTCGEYRASLARGKEMMEGGRMWFFGGDHVDALLTISAFDYNNMWLDWGLLARPDDFDQRVAERWGVPLADKRNPYPLPGEDPNATHGGSGQLPAALTQLRDEAGNYLGRVSFNCHWCHSGKVGDSNEGEGLGTLYGSGNSLLDISAGFGKFVGGMTSLLPLAANKTRGTGDILLYPAIAALDVDRAHRYNPSLANAASQGSVDYPVWWNIGHRTRRFHDGSFAMDDARPVMGFFMPIATATRMLDIGLGRQWIDDRDDDVQRWLESLRAPHYPGPIDPQLAEVGAVLFHNKDLWAPELNNPVPRPAAASTLRAVSCASCHGVYSPRYVNDVRYLSQPELEGIAAFVVPIDVIDTDRARFASLNDGLKETLSYSWWGYGEPNEQGACFGAIEPGGYLAPPLHGVWASAPYFHNASVPNIWEVLKPTDRKQIWRRVSAPTPVNDANAFMGFDTNLARAYDHERLGWRYEALSCGDPLLQPERACYSADPETNQAAEDLASGGFNDLWFTWNIAPQPASAAALEARKIYNTHHYSQGNHGHAFTAVLTDQERHALIEYLKTL